MLRLKLTLDFERKKPPRSIFFFVKAVGGHFRFPTMIFRSKHGASGVGAALCKTTFDVETILRSTREIFPELSLTLRAGRAEMEREYLYLRIFSADYALTAVPKPDNWVSEARRAFNLCVLNWARNNPTALGDASIIQNRMEAYGRCAGALTTEKFVRSVADQFLFYLGEAGPTYDVHSHINATLTVYELLRTGHELLAEFLGLSGGGTKSRYCRKSRLIARSSAAPPWTALSAS